MRECVGQTDNREHNLSVGWGVAAFCVLLTIWAGCAESDGLQRRWSVKSVSPDGKYAMVECFVFDTTDWYADYLIAKVDDLPGMKYTIIDTLPDRVGWGGFVGGESESIALFRRTEESNELMVRRFTPPKRDLTLAKSDASDTTAWLNHMADCWFNVHIGSDTILTYVSGRSTEIRSLSGDSPSKLLGTLPDTQFPSLSVDGWEMYCIGRTATTDDYPTNTVIRFDILAGCSSVACDPGLPIFFQCQSLGQSDDIFFLALDDDPRTLNIYVCDLGGNYKPVTSLRYPEHVTAFFLTDQGITYTVKNKTAVGERVEFLNRVDWEFGNSAD